MTAEKQNITGYYSGNSLKLAITVKDPSGAVVDLSGASIRWALTETYDQTVLVRKSTADGGIVITDAENGTFEINVDPQDTDDLSGEYDHECEVTDSGGNVVTVTTGTIEITPSEV